jgi:outer membrane protein assembly factor BamB
LAVVNPSIPAVTILFPDFGGCLIRFIARRWLLIVTLVVLTFALAACGGAAPVTSWPGYIVQADTAYLTSATQLDAVNIGGDTAGVKLVGWPVQSPNASIGYYAMPALADDGKTLYVATEQANGNSGQVQAWANIERGTQTAPSIKWTYPHTTTDYIPGNIYGAVVLDGGVLYFGDGKGSVFALTAEDGRPYWPTPVRTQARIWSSVVVDDQNVYAASQDHNLYAINKKSGKQVWQFPGEGTDVDALVGSPTLYDGTVYVGSFGGVLYAVDAASGQLKWSFKAEGGLWDGPAIVSGTLYFGDQAGNVYALDAATGQNKRWSVKVEGGVKMTPLVDNGVVYVGTDSNRLYALKADTGQSIWNVPYKARDGESLLITPTVFENTLVVLPNLAGANPTRLIGLNKNTGQELWLYPAKQP